MIVYRTSNKIAYQTKIVLRKLNMGHPPLGRQSKEDPSEFKARLVHKASSRIACIVTERKIM